MQEGSNLCSPPLKKKKKKRDQIFINNYRANENSCSMSNRAKIIIEKKDKIIYPFRDVHA